MGKYPKELVLQRREIMDSIILVITTALISGLLATLITIWWQKRNATYKSKMKIFETLMSYRYMIVAEESVHALNSVDVVFYKDTSVRKAYSDFLNEADKKPELNPNIADKHLKLLEEMAKALKLKYIHWDDIKHSYYPNGLREKAQEEALLRKVQIQNAINVNEAQKQQQNTPTQDQFNQQLVIQLLPELIKNPDGLKALMEFGERFGNKQ